MTTRKPLVIVGGQVREMPTGDVIDLDYNAGTDPIIASFAGDVMTSTGSYRYYHPSGTNIVKVYASVGTPSSTGAITLDVKKNGVSILGSLITLAPGGYRSADTTLNEPLSPSDYLTVDVVDPGNGAQDLNLYLVVDALNVTTVPVSSTSVGSAGQLAYDASYLYVCVAPNTWKRTPLSSW